MPMETYLVHHGIKGQKWGIRNGPPYPLESANLTGANRPEDLLRYLVKTIKYSEYSYLKSPQETISAKSGSCHDQTLLELHELKRLGYFPKAAFVIEYNPKTGRGGMTHSFAYYKDGPKIKWIENAWDDNRGIHSFNSVSEIKDYITQKHREGGYGNKSEFPNLEFSNYGKHEAHEDLQNFVNNALDSGELH